MSCFRWSCRHLLCLLVPVVLLPSQAGAAWKKDAALHTVNRHLKGQIVDFTANHGKDNRMWSRSLGQRRDLYVYLPPGYDKEQRYPIMIYMHGFSQDEQTFLEIIPFLDEAIANRQLPPLIVAAPDGSLKGEPSLTQPGSFFINSQAGWFGDFVLNDVWDHVCSRYPIRPEREAHILAGASMGGFAAFNLGIQHRNAFGVVIGVHPPLNLRWIDATGDYFGDFDLRNWGWRDDLQGDEVIARLAHGLVKMRMHQIVNPLFAGTENPVAELSLINPIEMLDRCRLRNGELEMYAAFGGHDEFNIDAQVESFLYMAKCRGIAMGVGYDPEGRHDAATALRLLPGMIRWLGPRIAPYAPSVPEPARPSHLPSFKK